MAFLQTLKQKISGGDTRKDTAFLVYNALVAEARSPILFKAHKIPDTLDGRYDAIVLHISLFLIGAGKAMEEAGVGEMGRDIIGIFLKDMDRNLRELGVGDLSVGKQVKKMATGLYGRHKAYQDAVAGKNPETAIATALTRNLYRDEKLPKGTARGLGRHSLKVLKRMENLSFENIEAGMLGGRV